MTKFFMGVAFAGGAVLLASSAQAAVLLHQYSFNGDASDSVGGLSGTLYDNATASGGYLTLDGSGDYVDLGGYAIPNSNFSIAFNARATNVGGLFEMMSQGSSGGPGFYIGAYGSGMRLGDQFPGPSVTMPADSLLHSYILTSDTATGTHFYIDEAEVFSNVAEMFVQQSASTTYFGAQFGNFGEYFQGQLSDVRIYSGVASFDEISGEGPGADLPEPASLAIVGLALAGLGVVRRKVSAR